MDEISFERRLTETESRSKSNTHRLDDLERRQDDQEKLITSVEVLATRMGAMEDNVGEIKATVKALAEKPAKRWDGLVDKGLWAIVGAAITYLLTNIGF